jgi:hypothetical protein
MGEKRALAKTFGWTEKKGEKILKYIYRYKLKRK